MHVILNIALNKLAVNCLKSYLSFQSNQ